MTVSGDTTEGGDKDITFIDTLFAVTMGGSSRIWTCGFNGIVYHSDDGGRKWERQETGTHKTLFDIIFLDDRDGVACGQGGTILRTGDGGQKWEQLETPVEVSLLKIAFSNTQTACAVGDQGVVLYTNNGGKTWAEGEVEDETANEDPGDQEEDEMGMLLDEGDGGGREYILYGVSLADDNTGYAVGEFSSFLKTTDGGATWVNRPLSEAGGKSLFSVYTLSAEEIWVVGIDGIMLFSGDGGQNWRQVDLPVKKHLFAVKFYGNNGYVVGKEGIYLRSTDGGNSWEQIDIGAKFYLQDIAFSNSKDCGWIVGAHGWMLKTQNEGKSFQVVRSAPSGVSFIHAK
jgi:photosystem II stability/assembly factor-like uncharacterized protein